MKIKEIEAKSIIVESKLPDTDFVVNPYTGCELGCAYCYASFMGRFVNEPIESWGDYVYVKVNSVSLAEREIDRWPKERQHARILLSSVTDPYQGIETKYELTRGILRAFADRQYPGLISILTKSPVVLRDLDILRRLPKVEIGITVTTTDDRLSRFLEVRAPLASRRLTTLKKLHAEGFDTYAFVGPLLPHFRYESQKLEELFAAIADAGVRSLFVEHINLKKYIRQRLWDQLKDEPQEIQDVYRGAAESEHRAILDGMVRQLIEKYRLKLRLAEVLYHNSSPAQPVVES